MKNIIPEKINIILNDKNVIVAEKPAGIPCQPDKTNDTDFMTLLSSTLKINLSEIFLVHRLDRPVGGIMVLAKNKKSSAFLSRQIQDKTFKKTYLAVVCGVPSERTKELKDFMIKNERLNISKIVNKGTSGAKQAILTYTHIETTDTADYGKLSLLKIDLKTGRHHQIRLQLSNIGVPIWGDTKYNNNFKRNSKYTATALFSNSIEFVNPTTKKTEKYSAFPTDIFPFDIFKKQ